MMKSKKFVGALLTLCMIMAMASPALAAGTITPTFTTDTATHELNAGSTDDTVNWPGSSTYCYWKIAVQNRSSAMVRVQLYKDGTTDKLIRTMDVPAYQSKEFFTDTDDSDQILTNARYHLEIESVGGATNLNGTLWYKFSTDPLA